MGRHKKEENFQGIALNSVINPSVSFDPAAPVQIPSAPVTQNDNFLGEKIDKLTSIMAGMADKFERFFEGRISSRTLPDSEVGNQPIVPSAPAPAIASEVPEPKQQEYHVPVDFRTLTDEILNKNFGIEIIPLSDSPAFHFIIVVPEQYSSVSQEYKEVYKRDLRPKVIPYSEGIVGVRAWVEKVWSSFNPTIQALIVNDRTP